MNWVEIIKLRSAGMEDGLLEQLLRSLRSDRSRELVEIKTYRHAVFPNDFSMHLRWESERPTENGSVLGLRLAQALKEFGLIDHSIWIEEEK